MQINKIHIVFSRSGILKLLGTLGLLLFLSACASSVIVKGDIPQPLVNKLPLTGNLVYTDAFKNYTYIENQKQRRGVVASFDFKEAQVAMFDQIFGALLTLDDRADASNDLSIEPEILDFQYATPNETSTTQYEVWLKYRLKILDRDQQKIGDWVVKGYGKTPTATLQSTGAAFGAAAKIALRDVGAQLAIRFPTQSSVQQVIATKGDLQSSSAVATQVSDASSVKAVEEENSLPIETANEKINAVVSEAQTNQEEE